MRTIITILCLLFFVQIQAQNLAPDQNPSYLTSQNKYILVEDSLQNTMNTTVQQTYKAFDWYQFKQERKQNRINTRQQIRINRSMNSFDFNNNGWDNSGFNNNRWNNNRRNNNNNWNNGFNNNRFFSSIGFRSGNWFFWF